MSHKIEYGSSLPGTANDIAFALETMKQAGFVIRQPVGVDLREVACKVLGIDGDEDVEQLVGELASAIENASVSMPAPDVHADAPDLDRCKGLLSQKVVMMVDENSAWPSEALSAALNRDRN